MEETQLRQHIFQILTKRSDRLVELAPKLTWYPNLWMGVSVENYAQKFRIDHLRSTPAKVKFLSLEPLIGLMGKLNLNDIHWVIVGGESGPGARPMHPEWVRDIRDQCQTKGVPFFFKQWGRLANNPDLHDVTAKENGGDVKGGRLLDGRTWDEMPKAYSLRPAKQGRSKAAAANTVQHKEER